LPPELNEVVVAYDMLGEVLDDVLDRIEDLKIHNPNRLLVEINEYGKEQALQSFELFVAQLVSTIHPYQQQLSKL
jgi:hypothetical protein